MPDFQRAHEPLPITTSRLGRKYGQEELLFTVIDGYEKAKGVENVPPAKESVKFITLAQAAERYGIPASKLNRGIEKGILLNIGTFQHPDRPDKVVTLVDESEVQRSKDKLGASKDLSKPKLFTLKQAAAEHNLPYGTLRSWRRGGYLPERGREVFPTKGGGKILVDENDVVYLKNHRPGRGRPQVKTSAK